MSTADAAVRGGESDTPMRATYQDVLDAPANRVAEIPDASVLLKWVLPGGYAEAASAGSAGAARR